MPLFLKTSLRFFNIYNTVIKFYSNLFNCQFNKRNLHIKYTLITIQVQEY